MNPVFQNILQIMLVVHSKNTQTNIEYDQIDHTKMLLEQELMCEKKIFTRFLRSS